MSHDRDQDIRGYRRFSILRALDEGREKRIKPHETKVNEKERTCVMGAQKCV